LPFRENGVKSQRGFTRTRKSGKHHEGISRHLNCDVLKIVNPGALDDKKVLGLVDLGIHVYKPNPAATVNLDVSSLLHLA
jgi:hypothetical protein